MKYLFDEVWNIVHNIRQSNLSGHLAAGEVHAALPFLLKKFKAAFTHSVSNCYDEAQLKQFVCRHQHDLKLMINSLTLSPQTPASTVSIAQLIKLFTFLHRCYGRYFDESIAVPYAFVEDNRSFVQQFLQSFYSKFYQTLGIRLTGLLLLPLLLFTDKKNITLAGFKYVSLYIRNLRKLLTDTELNRNACIEFMLKNGMNDPLLKQYLAEIFLRKVNRVNSVYKKTIYLQKCITWLRKSEGDNLHSLHPAMLPPASEPIIWLQEELKLLPMKILPTPTGRQKIRLAVSAATFAIWLRLMAEAGVFAVGKEYISEFIRIATRMFDTSRKETLSEVVMRNNYYNCGATDVNKVNDSLFEMIKLLKRY